MSALEDRLGRLDLQLPCVGDHLADERIALIAQGADPSPAEAAHLAGCDACTELLVAVGVGFESALATLPDAAEWVRPATPAASSTPWGVWLGGSGLLVSAIALWVALGGSSTDAPAPASTAPASAASGIPFSAAPAIAPASTSRASTITTGQVARSRTNTPSEQAPLPTPAARAATARRSAPKAARLTAQPLRVRGPRAVERRPVDGPPQGAGYLRLNAKPPAKVYLDGTFIGWTPLIDHRLLEGPHDVRLEYTSPRARVAEERFRVVIEPDRIWRSLRRNLKTSAD